MAICLHLSLVRFNKLAVYEVLHVIVSKWNLTAYQRNCLLWEESCHSSGLKFMNRSRRAFCLTSVCSLKCKVCSSIFEFHLWMDITSFNSYCRKIGRNEIPKTLKVFNFYLFLSWPLSLLPDPSLPPLSLRSAPPLFPFRKGQASQGYQPNMANQIVIVMGISPC